MTCDSRLLLLNHTVHVHAGHEEHVRVDTADDQGQAVTYISTDLCHYQAELLTPLQHDRSQE